MSGPGRRIWRARANLPPEVADAIGRLAETWRTCVESQRAKALGGEAAGGRFDLTHRRARSLEAALRGIYQFADCPVGEADLAGAIAAYGRAVAGPWYQADPAVRILTLSEFLADPERLAKWALKGRLGLADDERKAEAALKARREAEYGRERAAARSGLAKRAEARLAQLQAAESDELAAMERAAFDGLTDPMQRMVLAAIGPMAIPDVGSSRLIRALVLRRIAADIQATD